MNEKITNYVELAREDWSNLNFGDKRLNDRAIIIGESFLRNPFVSPPKMFKESKKLKAFYRFMDSKKVSHKCLISPHINNSKSRICENKIILAVQDSVTMTLKRNYEIEGLYDVGNIPGIVVHNTISVIPHKDYGLIDGLLHQIVHKRKPKNERTKEDNEIKLWMNSIDAVGIPPKGTKIVDVMDRAADTLEIMHHSLSLNHDFIIRAQYNRLIQDENYSYLFDLARSLPVAGKTTLEIQGNAKRKKRIAKLNITFTEVDLTSPKNRRCIKPIKCNLIHVCEVEVPDNQEALEWFLFTSLNIQNLDDALEIVKWYSYRWTVEEYHKCLKTGFRIEQTQLKTLQRIEALLGFISISSIKLLQMRDIVRRDPDTDAKEYVENEDIEIVRAYYKVKETKMTIDRFLRYIAMMGGFLNRKSDGNPGWQSIWEGWKFFMSLKEGVRLFRGGLRCG